MPVIAKWLSFAGSIGAFEWSLYFIYKFVVIYDSKFTETGVGRIAGPIAYIFGAVFLAVFGIIGLSAALSQVKYPRASIGLNIFCCLLFFIVGLLTISDAMYVSLAKSPISTWVILSFGLFILFLLAALLTIFARVFGANREPMFIQNSTVRRLTIALVTLLVSFVVWSWVLGYFDPKYNPQTVFAAFKSAGLEGEEARPITTSDFSSGSSGTAPKLDIGGVHFDIPSLQRFGKGRGGLILAFSNRTDLEYTRNFYLSGGNGAVAGSWQIFAKGNILVVFDFPYLIDQAKAYDLALNDL